jgi:hypothetical protein
LQGVIAMPSSSTTSTVPQLDEEHIFVSFSVTNIVQTNENKYMYKEYDEGLEELMDVGANACATGKTSMESKENNTHCVSVTPLFLDMFPYIRNNTYLWIDTKLSTVVGHWNKPRMTCHQEWENDEIIHMFAIYTGCLHSNALMASTFYDYGKTRL